MGYLLQRRKTTQIIPRKSFPCKARSITEILHSRSWEGKRSFIFCGGPSLENFSNFEPLRNECTIGINKSFLKYPTTICYAMDQRFYDSITYTSRKDPESSELHNAWISFKGIRVFSRYSEKIKLDPSIYYVTAIKNKCISLDLCSGIYTGGNSGFGGMMLAIALGSKQIYLLGCDMKVDEKKKKTHWHSGYPHQAIENVARVLRSFKQEFEEFAPSIQKLGISIVNLNPDSALDCFPKKDIREVI